MIFLHIFRRLKTQLSQQTAKTNELAHRLKDDEDQKVKNMFNKERLRAVRKIVGEDHRSHHMMNKTVSDPDISSFERENQYKRKPLSTVKSNNDVTSTPTPTPRRVRSPFTN